MEAIPMLADEQQIGVVVILSVLNPEHKQPGVVFSTRRYDPDRNGAR